MNFKLDYITRILQKTSKKRIEHYVISRIWHQLNNDEIKISLQQYVHRNIKNFALTDLYFPQLNYHIEVNEEFHYKDDLKISADKLREEDIIRNTKGHTIRFIECQNDKTLNEIHLQIDQVVEEINKLVEEQKRQSKFRVWDEEELTPKYWKQKGSISVDDNVNLRTIDEIGFLFDEKIMNKGFLKPGAIKYTKDGFSEVWWPSEIKKSNWENKFENDFEIITEKNIVKSKANNHVQHYVYGNPECKRIVFFKYKDELGFNFYKFVGCFKLNSNRSLIENQLVWERFSKHINLIMEKKPK
jgi:hypothetical protein